MATHGEARKVQAVQNSLDIVETLRERSEAGVTELASELGLSKGTVHSHLSTLLENEYVVRDEDTYRLSLKFLQLSQSVKDELKEYEIVKQELDELAEKSGELAQFATIEHGKAVYLYKARGENAVQTASVPGKRQYLHCISLGKAMLAYMSQERVDEIIEKHGLPRQTENTITTREDLLEELEAIRERGYAFDDEEIIEGIRCVGAPVQANDEVFGAVSISGPSTRMQGNRYREELPNMVARSANVIEINSKFA